MSPKNCHCMSCRHMNKCKENNHGKIITWTNNMLPESWIPIRNEKVSLKKNSGGARINFIISFYSQTELSPFWKKSLEIQLPSRALINIGIVYFHFFQSLEWKRWNTTWKTLLTGFPAGTGAWSAENVHKGYRTSWYFQTNPIVPGNRGKLKVRRIMRLSLVYTVPFQLVPHKG